MLESDTRASEVAASLRHSLRRRSAKIHERSVNTHERGGTVSSFYYGAIRLCAGNHGHVATAYEGACTRTPHMLSSLGR